MIKLLTLAALIISAVVLVAGAAALYAVGEVTGDRPWTVAALVAGGGAVYVIGKTRNYAQTH